MDRQVLKGQAILLVEEQLNGRDLIAAPQRAGAAVWLAPHAAEALVCLDQFDFSWLVWVGTDCGQHPDVARRLQEAGVRFLVCANDLPGDITTKRGAPSIAKSGTPEEIVS